MEADTRVKTPSFDPVVEWHRIRQEIDSELEASGSVGNFDEKTRLQRVKIQKLHDSLCQSGTNISYGDLDNQLHAVDTAEFIYPEIDRLHQELVDGFDLDELVPLSTSVQLIAVDRHNRADLVRRRSRGEVDQKWEAINPTDALCISTGIAALATKEHIPLGHKVLDLGGECGTWALALAQCKYDVTFIERDARLIEEFRDRQQQLNQRGVRTGNIQPIHAEFFSDSTKNSPLVNSTITSADIIVCYPWPEELEDRLLLFSDLAKDTAVLVLHFSDQNFGVEPEMLDEFGLEVVGEKNEDVVFYTGLQSVQGGASWLMLKKKVK